MSDKLPDIQEEIRCLRIALSPFLTEHYTKVLQEAERRLSGEVSTIPGATFKKTKKKNPNKNDLYYKLLMGKGNRH